MTVDVSEDTMFADIANLKDISEMENDTHVSVQGIVRKVNYIPVHIYSKHMHLDS